MMSGAGPDAADLTLWRHVFAGICADMATALVRSAFSANIKDRRDLSCGLFLADGTLFAQAAHIPVHLGAMGEAVRAVLRDTRLLAGDVVLLNDPHAGGTHLPDLTVVAPFHVGGRAAFYVANRAHHADVGGGAPGSMAPASEIYQEGLIIPPVHLVRRGRRVREVEKMVAANSRTPEERVVDLRAQTAALRYGLRRMGELLEEHGPSALEAAAKAQVAYTGRLARAFVGRLPEGRWEYEDFLDDDGAGGPPVRIRVRLEVRGGGATLDFTGSDPQRPGCVNCPRAVTISAVLYTLLALMGGDAPPNEGALSALDLRVPAGSVLAAERPAPVAAGNVETSQRVVDVLLGVFAKAGVPVPAASCGTMSNLSIGGRDGDGRPFAHYETIAGGAGAGPDGRGESGVQTHMTNTLNTPVEALERRFPLRVRRYAVRRRSGGPGVHRGGDGLVREIELLADATVSLLAERRRLAPPGRGGGGAGARGRDSLLSPDGRRTRLGGKDSVRAAAGSVVRIETPGGGGFRPAKGVF